MIEKNRFVEDGIEVLESPHAPVLDYMLSTKFGSMWMQQKDEAYGDSLLHIAVELHNLAMVRIIIAK